MDCWNFCISWILSQHNHNYEESDFISSETFSGVNLLSKIWFLLLDYFDDVEIVHEYENIFINLQEDELPLLNEYKHRLDEFENKWGLYSNADITLKYLKKKLENNYCIIPIKKWEWSHLVVLREIEGNNAFLVDNKKWEFSVSKDGFEDLMDLYNWKYVLFVGK